MDWTGKRKKYFPKSLAIHMDRREFFGSQTRPEGDWILYDPL